MDVRIILLSGPVASGKSILARMLSDRFNMKLLRTSDLLRAVMTGPEQPGRISLQQRGDELDRLTQGTWVLDGLSRLLRGESAGISVIVDSVRIQEQIDAIRDSYKSLVTHIHLTAPMEVLTARFNNRQADSPHDEFISYQDVRSNETEDLVDDIGDIADVVIDTNRCTEEDVLIRAASHLRLYGEESAGCVDVIVGGQYGSEGKGQIAAYLARDYDLLVRVGGPNAGHKVFELPEPYTHHQLPSGTRRTSRPDLLIGPGAVLSVSAMLNEIAECNVDNTRLYIDRGAMVISEEDYETERDVVRDIGSTGQGVGAAAARRILQRNSQTKLAKDVPEFAPYLCDALDVLNEAFATNGRVCLEGTQGTGLSLYHGNYPYVTSRDTTVSGCIAEAGIPPSKVRRVVMVCRTYPIRVESPQGGTSGPMSQEISFKTVSERSGIPLAELERAERTPTTNRRRRIAEFDWGLLRKASLLNRPSDIALTFSDYLTIKNRAAKRFEQLDPDTLSTLFKKLRECQAHGFLLYPQGSILGA